jgi:hypothetical protein
VEPKEVDAQGVGEPRSVDVNPRPVEHPAPVEPQGFEQQAQYQQGGYPQAGFQQEVYQ